LEREKRAPWKKRGKGAVDSWSAKKGRGGGLPITPSFKRKKRREKKRGRGAAAKIKTHVEEKGEVIAFFEGRKSGKERTTGGRKKKEGPSLPHRSIFGEKGRKQISVSRAEKGKKKRKRKPGQLGGGGDLE